MNIRIYIRKHCLSCEEVIQYFQKKGLEIETIDVTYDQNRFDEMFKLGGIATPLIVIDNWVIHSFDKAKLNTILEGEHE